MTITNITYQFDQVKEVLTNKVSIKDNHYPTTLKKDHYLLAMQKSDTCDTEGVVYLIENQNDLNEFINNCETIGSTHVTPAYYQVSRDNMIKCLEASAHRQSQEAHQNSWVGKVEITLTNVVGTVLNFGFSGAKSVSNNWLGK